MTTQATEALRKRLARGLGKSDWDLAEVDRTMKDAAAVIGHLAKAKALALQPPPAQGELYHACQRLKQIHDDLAGRLERGEDTGDAFELWDEAMNTMDAALRKAAALASAGEGKYGKSCNHGTRLTMRCKKCEGEEPPAHAPDVVERLTERAEDLRHWQHSKPKGELAYRATDAELDREAAALIEKKDATIAAMREALTLAANRLSRLALDAEHNSNRRYEIDEWAEHARRARSLAGK